MNILLIILLIINIMILMTYRTELLTGDKTDIIRKFLETNEDISKQPFYISGHLQGDIDEQTSNKIIELSGKNEKNEIKSLLKI